MQWLIKIATKVQVIAYMGGLLSVAIDGMRVDCYANPVQKNHVERLINKGLHDKAKEFIKTLELL